MSVIVQHRPHRKLSGDANNSFLQRMVGLRIKENKEVYEGEVTELTPEEMETEGGGYGKVCLLFPFVWAALDSHRCVFW